MEVGWLTFHELQTLQTLDELWSTRLRDFILRQLWLRRLDLLNLLPTGGVLRLSEERVLKEAGVGRRVDKLEN